VYFLSHFPSYSITIYALPQRQKSGCNSITHLHHKSSLSATHRTPNSNQALITSIELLPSDDHIAGLLSVEYKKGSAVCTKQSRMWRYAQISRYRTDGKPVTMKFYVLLIVHLGIMFVNNQLDTQFFFM